MLTRLMDALAQCRGVNSHLKASVDHDALVAIEILRRAGILEPTDEIDQSDDAQRYEQKLCDGRVRKVSR